MKKRKTALILYSLLIRNKRMEVEVKAVMRSFMYTRHFTNYPIDTKPPHSLVYYILSCNRLGRGYIDLEVSGFQDPEMEHEAICSLVKEIRGYKVSGVTVSINGKVLNL
jgi:hypothetical protein